MTEREILERQQALLDAARNGNRDLTADEQAEYDSLQANLNQICEAAPNQAAAPQTSAAEPDDAIQRAIAAERQRTADINELCRSFSIDGAEYIRSGMTMDQVREAVLKDLRANHAPSAAGINVTEAGEDNFRRDMADAMCAKAGVEVQNASAEAQNMRSMSLRDMAISCLSREGRNANELLRMNPDDLYQTMCRQFYNPTAAFPAILDSSIKKSIVDVYKKVPTSFEKWTTKGSLSDFKETKDHEYLMGGAGEFLKVPENGELQGDKPSTELLPTRKIETYGRQFTMTRQAFINDDIGFMTRIPGVYAAAAKRTIDKQCYEALFNNVTFADGVKLFHEKHGNLVKAGSAPSQAAIQNMILMMQKQKDPFGDALYMTPKYIVVPVGYGFDLDVILHSAQVVGSANNDKNPLATMHFEVVESPVLNTLAGENAIPWFIVADEYSAKTIQVDYLNGQETPTIRRMETPGKLGFVWDIYLDWGVSVRDFRGIVMNPGAKMA